MVARSATTLRHSRLHCEGTIQYFSISFSDMLLWCGIGSEHDMRFPVKVSYLTLPAFARIFSLTAFMCQILLFSLALICHRYFCLHGKLLGKQQRDATRANLIERGRPICVICVLAVRTASDIACNSDVPHLMVDAESLHGA